MIKRILVPLDGSELAEGVLPYVQQIATKTGAETILLTCIYQIDSWNGYLAQVDTRKETALVQTYLEGKREELQAKGLKVTMEIAYGPPAEAVLSYAADEEIDLIAMSTHGRSGISRWVFGSVADKVLHGTSRPLLLVRADGAPQEGAKLPSISKILVPLDGSELSLAVLPFVEDLARALGASLVLFHVVPSLAVYPEVATRDFLGELLGSAHQLLGRVASEVQQRGLRAEYVVTVGFAVDGILRAARDVGADLIALSTHGRSGLGRWVMGSVADAVVRRTHLPSLVVRPSEAGKES